MEIDPHFIDCDFSRDDRFVFGDHRIIGESLDKLPVYEQQETIIDPREYPALAERLDAEPIGLEWLVSYIHDQQREGQCGSDATTQGMEIKQAEMVGLPNVTRLSAASLYQRIARGPDSGSTMPDNLEEASKRGVMPQDNEINRQRYGNQVMPHVGFYNKPPQGWEAVAASFRIDEASKITTTGGIFTALFCGHPVIVGRQGHAICYVRPKYERGRLGVVYANSWAIDWGFAAGAHAGGFGFDSESLVRQSAQWAFAIRSVIFFR